MGARHPKPYKGGKDGKKEQVTVPWKKRAIAKLEANKRDKKTPSTPEQLKVAVGAPKGGINKLLDLDRDPPQLTSAYVFAISEKLEILPPVLETEEDDDDFAADVLLLRSLNTEARRELMITAGRLPKKLR